MQNCSGQRSLGPRPLGPCAPARVGGGVRQGVAPRPVRLQRPGAGQQRVGARQAERQPGCAALCLHSFAFFCILLMESFFFCRSCFVLEGAANRCASSSNTQCWSSKMHCRRAVGSMPAGRSRHQNGPEKTFMCRMHAKWLSRLCLQVLNGQRACWRKPPVKWTSWSLRS